MELFLPGLIVLVVSAFFVFLILPRMGPTVLAVVCLIALIAAGVNHYSMFYSEYKLSTWQYSLAAYTPWVVLGFAFVFIISTAFFLFSSPEAKANMLNKVATPMATIQNAVANSAVIMPPANTATNPVTSAINSVIINTTTANNTTQQKQNKSPNIPGLGYSASNV